MQQVGAEVVPGDRDVRVTLQRYLWKARYLAYKNAGKMHKPGDPMRIGVLPMLHRMLCPYRGRPAFGYQKVAHVLNRGCSTPGSSSIPRLCTARKLSSLGDILSATHSAC